MNDHHGKRFSSHILCMSASYLLMFKNWRKTTNTNVCKGRLWKQGFWTRVSTTTWYRSGLQPVDDIVGCVNEALHTVGDACLGARVQLVAWVAHARIPAPFCQSVHELLEALPLRLHLHKPLHSGILKCVCGHPWCGCHKTEVVFWWWRRGSCCNGSTCGDRFDGLGFYLTFCYQCKKSRNSNLSCLLL